jgi:anti-sigma regulatory factor (Ser/Thr protein kinase)
LTTRARPRRSTRHLTASGRGLFLIRHMVDDVHFNTQGNSICMTLRRQ